MSFIHLQCHSEYSLLESPIRIAGLLDRAIELNMPAVALTDNGSMFGAIQFYLGAKKRGLNPIMGCEMYITPDISVKERSLYRLILLCKNYKGYQNLIHLVTLAHLDGFYYKPRIDIPHLAQNSEGLIAISSGMRGPIGYPLRQNNTEEAKLAANALKKIYGDNLYLGLHRLDMPQEAIFNEMIKEFAQTENLPLVALNDVYYLHREDAEIKDILGCIQTGRLYHEDSRAKLNSQELYFKTPEQMKALFKDFPGAVENTVKISEMCNVVIETEQVTLPHFECPPGLTSEAYLEKLVWEGIHKKYTEITPEIKNRVKIELEVINPMQYAPYFLIIHDFLSVAAQKGIPTGPGRGSAAGSIVAYALDITKIDPIKYNLLFERFLNPERVSMPDIDLDFCIRRRGEIIEYLVQRYGKDHVSQIATFGTMAARGVIRDVGRVLNVPLKDVDRIAKLIPSFPGQACSIPEALEQVTELKQLCESTEEYKELIKIGTKLEGVSRHTSTHAAGVVISRDPLSSVVPLLRNEGQVATHFPMSDLEKIGLLKMDILGLRNLTVMDDAVKLIATTRGIEIDLNDLPIDDPKTYELLSTGNTMGIFQLEGRGMRTLIKEMRPQVFEDIIAALALYRPGPLGSGMVSEYISNKQGKTKVKYDLPELEPILNETHGLIVYQEQVMQIASIVGGFSLGQADMLRRAMGKKKKEEMDKLREEFLDGAKSKGFDLKKSEKIFDLCYKFAEYGFNKSHSAAYALISFQTAYLKANYPVEYMAALLSSVFGSSDRVSGYIQECRQMGIAILPPDINCSGMTFSIENEGIRFGLGAIKNVGETAILSIIQNRKDGYKSLSELCERVDLRQVNKRVLENLIKSGACDSLGERGYLIDHYESIADREQSLAKERENGQIGLFNMQEYTEKEELKMGKYISPKERLTMEKELLGLYLSGHPLDDFRERISRIPHTVEMLKPEDENQRITLLALLTNCRKMITKTKKEMMIATVEDLTGEIEIVLFQSAKFEQFSPLFQNDTIAYIQAKVRVSQEEISLICEHIEPVSIQNKILYVDTENIDEPTVYQNLHTLSIQNRGTMGIRFLVGDTRIAAHEKYGLADTPETLAKLEILIGAGHYWIV